jgi:hypothetical protein
MISQPLSGSDGILNRSGPFSISDYENLYRPAPLCANGKSYLVSVFPNGHSSVIDCALLEAVNGGHCFTKMNDDSCSQN